MWYLIAAVLPDAFCFPKRSSTVSLYVSTRCLACDKAPSRSAFNTRSIWSSSAFFCSSSSCSDVIVVSQKVPKAAPRLAEPPRTITRYLFGVLSELLAARKPHARVPYAWQASVCCVGFRRSHGSALSENRHAAFHRRHLEEGAGVREYGVQEFLLSNLGGLKTQCK